MGRFVLRRLWSGLLVIVAVTVIVFVITRLVSDPVRAMLPIDATEAQRAALSAQLGLDRPVARQFADFMGGVARLDLGESLWQRRPVTDIVVERLPATLALIALSMAFAIALAIPLGMVAALKPGGVADRLTVLMSLLGLSIPQFWLGLLLIIVFAVDLKWLPTSGIGTPAHIILPALTLALPALARMVMIVRSAAIDELNAQYVKVLTAKGLPFRRIVGVHALKNITVPTMTLAGWEIIRALAGYSFVVEQVFAWPGLGLAAVQAIERQDLVLLQGIVLYVAVMVVLINAMLDVAQKMVDPRVTFA